VLLRYQRRRRRSASSSSVSPAPRVSSSRGIYPLESHSPACPSRAAGSAASARRTSATRGLMLSGICPSSDRHPRPCLEGRVGSWMRALNERAARLESSPCSCGGRRVVLGVPCSWGSPARRGCTARTRVPGRSSPCSCVKLRRVAGRAFAAPASARARLVVLVLGTGSSGSSFGSGVARRRSAARVHARSARRSPRWSSHALARAKRPRGATWRTGGIPLAGAVGLARSPRGGPSPSALPCSSCPSRASSLHPAPTLTCSDLLAFTSFFPTTRRLPSYLSLLSAFSFRLRAPLSDSPFEL